MKKNNVSGFTLAEVLITLTILGITDKYDDALYYLAGNVAGEYGVELIKEDNPKIFLDVNFTPVAIFSDGANFGKTSVISIPISIANTGAPIISKLTLPIFRPAKKVAMPAITTHTRIPKPFFLIKLISSLSYISFLMPKHHLLI